MFYQGRNLRDFLDLYKQYLSQHLLQEPKGVI